MTMRKELLPGGGDQLPSVCTEGSMMPSAHTMGLGVLESPINCLTELLKF